MANAQQMREKLHNIAWNYSQYDVDDIGERRELMDEWNNTVATAERYGISHKEMNAIFHNPDTDIARRYSDRMESIYERQRFIQPIGGKTTNS